MCSLMTDEKKGALHNCATTVRQEFFRILLDYRGFVDNIGHPPQAKRFKRGGAHAAHACAAHPCNGLQGDAIAPICQEANRRSCQQEVLVLISDYTYANWHTSFKVHVGAGHIVSHHRATRDRQRDDYVQRWKRPPATARGPRRRHIMSMSP
jgi:hypothetical protein